jgi:hypothetical protein
VHRPQTAADLELNVCLAKFLDEQEYEPEELYHFATEKDEN